MTLGNFAENALPSGNSRPPIHPRHNPTTLLSPAGEGAGAPSKHHA